MKVRIFENKTGSGSVIHPAPKSKRPNETDEQWLARVFEKATPKGVEFKDIDHSELPQDREYRNTWKYDNVQKKIYVDEELKKGIDISKKG